jgi:hypothetical protein
MTTRAAVLRKAGTRGGSPSSSRTRPGASRSCIPVSGKWREGHIKLTELIINKYALDEINDGYQDLMDGKNIRGVVVHQHS